MANDRVQRHDPLSDSLVEALGGGDPETGAERVAAARRHAEGRSFDEPAVLRAIASELLAMSGSDGLHPAH